MAYGDEDRTRDRIKSGGAVALICLLVGWGLINGIQTDFSQRLEETIDLIALNAPEPPTPTATPPPAAPAPEPSKAKNPEGAAAPKSLKAKATQVVRPEPKIEIKTKNDVTTTKKAGVGNDKSQGASDTPGVGTGAGGVGTGTGSGASGSGEGGGGRGAGWGPARKIAGDITNARDYPGKRREFRNGKSVRVRFTIMTNGRVSNCRVIRPSGSPEDDQITCRLIEERWRYQPARDQSGQPISSEDVWTQYWWLERRS